MRGKVFVSQGIAGAAIRDSLEKIIVRNQQIAVFRNDRGDRGNVGIIRSPVRASILPDDPVYKWGANPAEVPVQLPTKYEMVLNLKTAKALGVAVPLSIRLRADEVIE
jgi:hypothetical protein